MDNLSNLLNDVFAVTKLRVQIGNPTEEQHDPHPMLTEDTVVVSTISRDSREQAIVHQWLEDNAPWYGYEVCGSYCGDEAVIRPRVL